MVRRPEGLPVTVEQYERAALDRQAKRRLEMQLPPAQPGTIHLSTMRLPGEMRDQLLLCADCREYLGHHRARPSDRLHEQLTFTREIELALAFLADAAGRAGNPSEQVARLYDALAGAAASFARAYRARLATNG